MSVADSKPRFSRLPSRLFDHIDLRVSNAAAARPLYDAFLPALGFTKTGFCHGVPSYGMDGDTKNSPFIG